MKRTIQKCLYTPSCGIGMKRTLNHSLRRDYQVSKVVLAKKKRAGTMSTEALEALETKQRLTQASGYHIDGEWVPRPSDDLLPQPVRKYTGNKKRISVAYILTRKESITPDRHPLQQMENQQNINERNHFARHNFSDLWQYGAQWQREFSKLPDKKKKKSVADLASERFDLREAPKRSEREETLYQCSLGGNRFTPHEQYFFSTFEPQAKHTLADFEQSRKNLRRALYKPLYLIVKLQGKDTWCLPEAERRIPETLRLTAQTKFMSDMGELLQGYFDSHAPIAHMDRSDDDQLFFYKTTYLAGRPPLKRLTKEGWEDHAWVTREELADYEFENDNYRQILMDVLH
mmetsp:Transcript_5305/g.7825  ORF Transcript_5305/g.7825 Transcript_5305/m.7825 type:complete len:345 (+) Transcript_5305:88-1122(+)